VIIRNEFAVVDVSVDTSARGPRLRIADLESGVVAFYDPLEVASLTLWPPERRAELLLVGAYRRASPGSWIGSDQGEEA
jgi:hypothetical protein